MSNLTALFCLSTVLLLTYSFVFLKIFDFDISSKQEIKLISKIQNAAEEGKFKEAYSKYLKEFQTEIRIKSLSESNTRSNKVIKSFKSNF